jgi:hypothetical protein
VSLLTSSSSNLLDIQAMLLLPLGYGCSLIPYSLGSVSTLTKKTNNNNNNKKISEDLIRFLKLKIIEFSMIYYDIVT